MKTIARNPEVAAFLKRVQGGDVNAVGPLADFLEDKGLPYARTVRAAWDTYTTRRTHYARRDWSRTRWTQREVLAWAAEALRLRIGRTFRLGWRRKGQRRRTRRR